MSKTELKILDFSKNLGRNIVAVKILKGELKGEMQLKSIENGSIWRIKGSAFLPVEKWEDGIRGLILESESESLILNIGDKLIS